MTPSKFKILIILGKSGSGKGTQASLLAKKFHFEHVSTGDLLRKRAKRKDFLGRKIKEVLDAGGLMTSIVISLWVAEFGRWKKQRMRGVILEGSPRKLYEAWALDEMLEWYGWDNDTRVLHIAVSDKEALKRLLQRGRADDEKKAIQNRLAWFHKEVEPVLGYYRKKKKLVKINGEQSIEDVSKDVLEKLKDFLA